MHRLKTRLAKAKGVWVDELLSILWVYRTISKISIDEMLFNLVYGTKALILVKIGVGSPQLGEFNEGANSNIVKKP